MVWWLLKCKVDCMSIIASMDIWWPEVSGFPTVTVSGVPNVLSWIVLLSLSVTLFWISSVANCSATLGFSETKPIMFTLNVVLIHLCDKPRPITDKHFRQVLFINSGPQTVLGPGFLLEGPVFLPLSHISQSQFWFELVLTLTLFMLQSTIS